MIKPFPQGKGDGFGPTRYLMRLDYHGRKENPPVVLRGDPDMTRALIDSINREWKFTAGVCSWGPEDTITPEQEIQVMNNFEAVAFAGMQPDQYNILWVRHSHAGHHELHFVIPRMELSTGKAFNAFPPGWEKEFGPFRDLDNTRHGWTRPDDPERARLFVPSTADLMEARLIRWGKNPTRNEKEKARDSINDYIKAKLDTGTVRDRADVVTALREAGLEINREGKDYITVKDPDSGEKIRLKGGIYGAGWTLENFGRAHEGEGRTGTDRDGEGIHRTIADLKQQLAGIIDKRAAYNLGRFGTGGYDRTEGRDGPLQDFAVRLRQEMDLSVILEHGEIVRNAGGRLGAGESRGMASEQLPDGIDGIGEPMPSEARRTAESSRGGGSIERNVGNVTGTIVGGGGFGDGRQSLRDGPDWERTGTHSPGPTGNQVEGLINHEQKRTGNDSIAMSRTNRDGINDGTSEPGREDQEAGKQSDRLRTAIDALERAVSALGAAYRKLEQYLERRQEVTLEQREKPRGMSR